MLSMVLAVIPIVGAVDDQNTNVNEGSSSDGLQIGVTGGEINKTQNVLQKNKPFGENTTKVLGTNNTNQTQIMKLGATGDKVKEIQQWLTDYGYYSGNVDGVFGTDTEEAVKTFQEEAGLIVDGVVGNDTSKAMKSWDKYVADVQAAAGESDYTAETTTDDRQYYANAVRDYGQQYYNYGGDTGNYYGNGYSGDCWDVSNAAYNQLTSSGQRARIVQYANSYVNNHRSVQVYSNGKWNDYYNVAQVGVPTKRLSSQKVIKN